MRIDLDGACGRDEDFRPSEIDELFDGAYSKSLATLYCMSLPNWPTPRIALRLCGHLCRTSTLLGDKGLKHCCLCAEKESIEDMFGPCPICRDRRWMVKGGN